MERIKKILYEFQPKGIQQAVTRIINSLKQKYQKFWGTDPLANGYLYPLVELNVH